MPLEATVQGATAEIGRMVSLRQSNTLSRCDPAWKSDPLRRGIGVQN